jgi:hypothetical protein
MIVRLKYCWDFGLIFALVLRSEEQSNHDPKETRYLSLNAQPAHDIRRSVYCCRRVLSKTYDRPQAFQPCGGGRTTVLAFLLSEPPMQPCLTVRIDIVRQISNWDYWPEGKITLWGPQYWWPKNHLGDCWSAAYVLCEHAIFPKAPTPKLGPMISPGPTRPASNAACPLFKGDLAVFSWDYLLRMLHEASYVASLKGVLRPNRGFLAIGASNHIGPKLTNLIPPSSRVPGSPDEEQIRGYRIDCLCLEWSACTEYVSSTPHQDMEGRVLIREVLQLLIPLLDTRYTSPNRVNSEFVLSPLKSKFCSFNN